MYVMIKFSLSMFLLLFQINLIWWFFLLLLLITTYFLLFFYIIGSQLVVRICRGYVLFIKNCFPCVFCRKSKQNTTFDLKGSCLLSFMSSHFWAIANFELRTAVLTHMALFCGLCTNKLRLLHIRLNLNHLLCCYIWNPSIRRYCHDWPIAHIFCYISIHCK